MADAQLLLQAAGAAVQEHQAGKLAPSVEDVLHLEKRWHTLPGASSGSVALEDAAALLGAEVLAGEPLEFVVAEVFPSGPPTLLGKRQFLTLAHVAEVAQSKAFDLVTAEDALRPQALPLSHKKRPPTIRDSHIDSWQIAAGAGQAAAEQHNVPQYEPAAALATAAPGPLESHLSRASSLQPQAGPLEQGAPALSSADGSPAADAETVAEQQQAATHRQQLLSAGTSYQSVEDCERGSPTAGEADEAADEFQAKLNGLMRTISSGEAAVLPATPEGISTADEAATAGSGSAGDEQAPPSGKTRSSWESFNSAPGSGGADGSGNRQLVAHNSTTPPQQQQQQQQPVNDAMLAAAVAAGMTFMQHLQGAGGPQSSLADVDPRRVAAAVSAAAAASPSVGSASRGPGGGGGSYTPASPESYHPAATHRQTQQAIAEMMARLNMGDASAEQLQAVAEALNRQAAAKQQQSTQQQPASSRSMASSAASGDPSHQQQQQQHQEASRLARRQRAAAVVSVDHLQAPRALSIAGWEPMSTTDVQRCRATFQNKGYLDSPGMQRTCAMEYFSKLHMQAHIFHSAWQAADLDGTGSLNCREFCLFIQMLRSAQKGRTVPERLTAEEAAALLGEIPMPPAPPLMHIDAAHLRSVLGHSRQHSMTAQEADEAVMQGFDQDDDDDASSIGSGMTESVSGMSVSSRAAGAAANPYAMARPSAQRSGLGSVLGGGAPSYRPAAFGQMQRQASFGASVGCQPAHSLLEVAVHSAGVRSKYRKTLSNPIFTVSVRDSQGRLVELPVDTHPGHFRPETCTIHSSAIIRLGVQLQHIPPGSSLFVEIKHWKSEKRQFSTLAWAHVPLEMLVDAGPSSSRVRSGPVDLPLMKKPLDITRRRTTYRFKTGRTLHLTVRGIE